MHFYVAIVLLCTTLLLTSCNGFKAKSFGCGNVDTYGQPNGPWVVYWRDYKDAGSYRVKAKGNFINGHLDGVWAQWGDEYGFTKFKVFQGMFKDGIPNGEFTVENMYQSGAGEPSYNTFQYIDGHISGTIEDYPYGDEFNIQVFVKYIVKNDQIVSVLSGKKEHAQRAFEALKFKLKWDIKDIEDSIKSSKPKDMPARLGNC